MIGDKPFSTNKKVAVKKRSELSGVELAAFDYAVHVHGLKWAVSTYMRYVNFLERLKENEEFYPNDGCILHRDYTYTCPECNSKSKS